MNENNIVVCDDHNTKNVQNTISIANDINTATSKLAIGTSTLSKQSASVSTSSLRKCKRRLANCKYYRNKYHNHSDISDDKASSAKKVTKPVIFDEEYIKDATKLGVNPSKLDFCDENMNGKQNVNILICIQFVITYIFIFLPQCI